MDNVMDLGGQLGYLSMKKKMGQDVDEEVKDLLRKCQSEKDKERLKEMCKAVGLL